MKEQPIDNDLELLLDETHDKRDRLQQHLTVIKAFKYNLKLLQNSQVNQNTIRSWKIMKNMLTYSFGSRRISGRIELKNGNDKRSNGFQIITRDK